MLLQNLTSLQYSGWLRVCLKEANAEMKKHLFVVAHPDDEVLGAGAFIHDAARRGDDVAVIILNTCDTTRYIDDAKKILDDMKRSHDILGIKYRYCFAYQDSNFHNVDHRDMVQQIEEIIRLYQPDTIFTQHPGDINTDHYWTAASCMEAFRLWQRGRENLHPIEALYLMEVQSSTDWGLNPSEERFKPNTYVEVSAEAVDAKVNALAVYENVIRCVPHPRSTEALYALPVMRGAQSGYLLAEAFE